MKQVYEKCTRIAAPAEAVFDFHKRDDAFEILTPPWEDVRVDYRTGTIKNGDWTVLSMGMGPVRQNWIAEHFGYIEGEQFCDRQVEGPFAFWEHTHRVEVLEPGACELVDHIEYELPLGALGLWGGGWLVRRKLERMFAYRHDVTRREVYESLRARHGQAA